MAKAGNPFEGYDFTKVWGEFSVPMFDVEALMMAQQRNFDAVSTASKRAVEGLQQVAQLQAERLRDALEQGSVAAQEYVRLTSTGDKLARQAQLARAAVEAGIDNAREVSGIMAKTAADTADIVNKRIIEGLDEFEGFVAKANGAAQAKPAPKSTSK